MRAMASAREDVDLWLILTDPIEARKYIDEFFWRIPRNMRPGAVEVDSGRQIEFKSMTDEDAVVAAMHILRHCEVPRAMVEKKIAYWEQ